VLSFDLFSFLSMGCLVNLDFYDELLATCVLPLVLAAGALGYARYVASRDWWRVFTQIYLVILFCIYPGVSRKILTIFKCESFFVNVAGEQDCDDLGVWRDDDACFQSFLRADYRLSCDDERYAAWSVFGGLMVALYPVGVPCLFWALLRRSVVHKASAGRTHELAFIKEAYKDEYYWWEVAEVLRKLFTTVMAVFFMEGSASQILVTLLVALAAFGCLLFYSPYLADDDNVVAAGAQMGIILASLSALCIKVNVTVDDAWSKEAFDTMLVMLLVSVPVLALLEVLLE
jgi:hypothetical protein